MTEGPQPPPIDSVIPRTPVPVPAGLVRLARLAHQCPPRHYHTWSHALAVAARWQEVRDGPGWSHPVEGWVAALYHDAVYVVGRTDNEVRSADLAERAIDRWLPTADARQVKHLIRLTAHHGSHGELGGDACLFLDCDMAILGASPGDFDAYEEAVGKEYRDLLDPEAWRVGRARFVERLLRLPRIFLSEFFHARLESRARANLSRSLSAIGTDSETARR